MMKLTCIAFAALLSVGASAQRSTQPTPTAPANSIELGTADSLVQSLAAQHRNALARFNKALGGESLAVEIKDFYDQSGQVSISGQALESSDSVFFLKGTRRNLRGYLVLHAKKKAFEYRTNEAGIVSVTEVPITKVYPDFDEDFQRSNRSNATVEQLAVAHPVYSSMALRQAPHIGPYANQDVTKLESKPGSAWVFYLNTAAVMSGSTPINGVTKEQMYRAWQSVADQYSMLKLNVTTNKAVYDAARAANPLRTGVINFINQDGRSFAPIHSFGTTSAGTLYRNPASGFDYGYGIGMTAAHEVGHQMGMLHDGGGSGGEYFEGIPAYQWGPIMGNYWQGGSWANQLFTWSKGEYNTASNREDDLRIMTVDEAVPYADDDNVNGKNLVLRANGEINPADNWGQIERNTDSDTFAFTLANAGTLNLRVDPIEYLRMLDVDASIVNAAGQTVARSNLSVNRSAEFVNLSLPAGAYKLLIQGGAEGTPQNGFSKYSSLGYYAVKGTLGGGTTPSATPLTSGQPLPNQTAGTAGWLYYQIDVPAGKTKLTATLAGNNGDADLYVAAGALPTSSSYACKSTGSASSETCSVNSPAAGRYYVGVYAYTGFNGLTVTATVSP
ncbi:pre-peptidase C-terminal domain-containing protein [Paucibacter sp. APW11]|uniref:Pre-peptidase C-terminal domain-containing protein n=1 Tax=Roseateles aquae TaxID=3077235 RepID=A0ABU3PEY5_9BURK|nr:pre-peptidase C-terminal domain-containing protein [Paucibacter sp. APW11]MDT9000466.1 pre-peptidase C-terminal domain-containing protein [Paucibacter sp. APW11]